MDDGHAAEEDIPPGQVVADRAQQLVEAEAFRLGHAPRHQHLAAHTVVELERALEHEDAQARPREQAAEPGAREPTPAPPAPPRPARRLRRMTRWRIIRPAPPPAKNRGVEAVVDANTRQTWTSS